MVSHMSKPMAIAPAVLVATAWATAWVTAQAAAQVGFATVTTAGPGEAVHSTLPFQRALAQDGERWFVLVNRTGADATSDLEIWSSSGGRDWELLTHAPTARDSHGAIVAEPGRLHLLWQARADREWQSVYFATFDLVASQWTDEPQCLAQGSGANDHYFANDLCVSDGVLVAAIGAHRSPKLQAYSSWSTCLRTLEDRDKGRWTDPARINVGSCAVWADLAAFDGIIHSSYRTYSGDDHCIAARRWDLATGRFLEQDVRVVPGAGETLRHTNAGLIAIDQLGHRYVMTVLGSTKPTDGMIVVAHAAADGNTWESLEIDADPAVQGGNTNPYHLALARGPGNQMLAFYSKAAEKNANLYVQVLDQGVRIGKPRVVERGLPGAFERLSGLRDTVPRVGVQLVVTSGGTRKAAEGEAPNEVRVHGFLRE